MRDAARYRLGWWASEPFWLVYQFGLRAERVHARILWWGERARKGSSPASDGTSGTDAKR